MTHSLSQFWAFGAACLVLSGLESAARAQPNASLNPDAVALFNEARALMRDGRYAEACPKLEKARSLKTGLAFLSI
jgi:hypothetical protein